MPEIGDLEKFDDDIAFGKMGRKKKAEGCANEGKKFPAGHFKEGELKCGTSRPEHFAKGLCRRCYFRLRKRLDRHGISSRKKAPN